MSHVTIQISNHSLLYHLLQITFDISFVIMLSILSSYIWDISLNS